MNFTATNVHTLMHTCTYTPACTGQREERHTEQVVRAAKKMIASTAVHFTAVVMWETVHDPAALSQAITRTDQTCIKHRNTIGLGGSMPHTHSHHQVV